MNDTTKINESESETVIQSENNKQVNLDEQDRRLRDRNKIRRPDRKHTYIRKHYNNRTI